MSSFELGFNRSRGPRGCLPLFLSGLLSLCALACEPSAEEVNARFRRAVNEPCPLFGDDFLSDRGLPICPFPTGTPPADLPCAIERYLGADPQPRIVRRLRYDSSGRVDRYSDHRAGRVIDARRFVHEVEDGVLSTEVYALLCSSPTPRYLYRERLRFDEVGRLIATEPEFARGHHLQYRFDPGWFRNLQEILVDDGQRTFRLDAFGHVVHVQEADGPALDIDLSLRNGRIVAARWERTGLSAVTTADYAYQDSRLSTLHLRPAPGVEQHYRFRYACQQSPGCNPGALPTPPPRGLTPSAMGWDPSFAQFKARDCTDQHRYGPRLCGEIDLPRADLQARCCNTDRPGIQIELRSGLAGADIIELVLALPDGSSLSSVDCRGRRGLSDCRFVRKELQELAPGPAKLQIRTDQGTIESLPVETRWFSDAAR